MTYNIDTQDIVDERYSKPYWYVGNSKLGVQTKVSGNECLDKLCMEEYGVSMLHKNEYTKKELLYLRENLNRLNSIQLCKNLNRKNKKYCEVEICTYNGVRIYSDYEDTGYWKEFCNYSIDRSEEIFSNSVGIGGKLLRKAFRQVFRKEIIKELETNIRIMNLRTEEITEYEQYLQSGISIDEFCKKVGIYCEID